MDFAQRISNILAEQRNREADGRAMAVAQLQESAESLRLVIAERDAAFKALNECILSGQIPDEDVPGVVGGVQGFAEWRKAQEPEKAGA